MVQEMGRQSSNPQDDHTYSKGKNKVTNYSPTLEFWATYRSSFRTEHHAASSFCGGMSTAELMVKVNSRGRQTGLFEIVRSSKLCEKEETFGFAPIVAYQATDFGLFFLHSHPQIEVGRLYLVPDWVSHIKVKQDATVFRMIHPGLQVTEQGLHSR